MIQAAFGGESAGGDGSPVFEVCQKIPSGSIAFVAVHPAGSAGGMTLSKLSFKTVISWPEQGGVGDGPAVSAVASWLGELPWPMAREEAIAPSAAKAAATKNNEQRIRRNRDGVSVRFGCVVIELWFYRFLVSKPRKFYILEEIFPHVIPPFEKAPFGAT